MKRIALILLLCCSSQAATFYVATTGNDANDGSIGSPWADIRYGVNTMAANDTLLIRGGTYGSPSGFVMQGFKSGTGANYTTVKNYPGETVVYHPTVANHGVLLQDKTNIWLEGWSVDATSSLYDALKITTGGTQTGGNIVLTNMSFWGCPEGMGVLTSGFDPLKWLLITHCNFYTNGWNGSSGGPFHQIYIQDSNVTVEYCYILGVDNALGGTPGIQLNNSDCTNQVYRNNFFTNCFDKAIIMYGFRSSAQVYNNVIVGSRVGLYMEHMVNSSLWNNSIYGSWNGIWIKNGTNISLENNLVTACISDSLGRFYITTSSNVSVANNLVCSNTSLEYLDFKTNTDNVSVTVANNLFARTAQGTNEIYNPGLVSPTTGNLRLLSVSSAKDAGKTQTIFTTDYDGMARAGIWEIGAFNFTATNTNSTLAVVNARSAP